VRREAESEVLDVSALRMREATITAALWMTFGVGALGALYVALTWSRPHRLELGLLFLASVISAAQVYSQRARIVRSSWREPFFLVWTITDFLMLSAGALLDGGSSSPMVLLFFMPVIFSSMSYPLGSVTAVGAIGVLSYLGVAFASGQSSAAYRTGFAFALLCAAGMSAWQSQNQKNQRRALETASRTDPLTGCLNRRGFQERALAGLGTMRRHGSTGAVVVLDIDNFKPVNDTHGHAAGDELLCWVAAKLQQTVRPSDAVGRLGGDEFAVLLPETALEDARSSAARIADALGERVTVSLGVASFPVDGTDLESLARVADGRLYASRAGRYDDQNAGGDSTVGPAEPAQKLGPTDLWRAALDAMPARAPRGGRERVRDDLQATLLDQIDASVVAADMQGFVISWNSGAELLYGWSAEEAIGQNARDLIVPEDAKAAETLMVELSRHGTWDGELLVRRKDGTPFTAYVRNRLVFDERGDPSAVVGVAVDVSERVAAESELLHSRDYARAVTQCIGEGLFTLDFEGRVTYLNRTAERLLGWSDGALRGQSIVTALQAARPDGSPEEFSASPIARALQEETTVRIEDDQFTTRSGRVLPVAYTATPFHTEDGLQGCVVIFQDISERKQRESDQRRDAEQLACINRLEQALAEDRFVLHAQPIVDLRSGRTVQHELLLRLHEPDGRLVAPGEFLPVAERYALIGEIDWWVIKQATQLAGSGCPVELNLSARSVGDPDVLEHIERCIEQSGASPGDLVFEITETAIIEDEQAARTFAERLHALGCKIALDDFGTGYGSLTYLKQIPVDYLKLDIEFVRDLATSSASHHVVHAIVSLARDFGLQTVGEGVEDARTLELLGDLGVDFAQGYHLARPTAFEKRPGDLSPPVQLDAAALRRPEPRRPRRPIRARQRA
jgi:diguanylate cyclase (GGDEF)-like protein/PAS domain S-box-containing protein